MMIEVHLLALLPPFAALMAWPRSRSFGASALTSKIAEMGYYGIAAAGRIRSDADISDVPRRMHASAATTWR